MLILICTIFVASVAGSLHCAGMCGAFVAIATGGIDATPRDRLKTQAAYHLGRLVTYVTMGTIAGAVGSMVNLAGDWAGIQRAAMMCAGGVMVIFGLLSLLRISGVRFGRMPVPAKWQQLVASVHKKSMRFEPVTRAGLIGLSTTLLPCGWLYAFVITAAGTGHFATGALAMLAFWMGTLPMMVSLGVGVQTLTGRFGHRVPALTCLLLIGVGMYTLLGRGMIDAVAVARATAASTQPTDEVPACCQVAHP